MKYKVQLVSDEVAVKTIDQNLTSRAFLFWRKFTITLTNKRLHTFQKFIISHAQRSFDLRDVDSIFQEKRFNGIYSFFLGFLLMILIVGFSVLLRMHFYGSLLLEQDPIRNIADYIGIGVWIIVFSLFFFKNYQNLSTAPPTKIICLIFLINYMIFYIRKEKRNSQ